VSGDYLPNIGGLAAHVHDLALALTGQGHLVSILTTVKGENSSGAIPVHRIPPQLSNSKFIARPQIIHQTRKYVDQLRQQEKVDIIHWHTLDHFCPALASLKNDAKVFTNHTSHFSAALKRGRKQRLKRQIGHADAWITVSKTLYEGTCELEFDEDRIHLIGSGVNTDQFAPGDQRQARIQLGLPPHKRVVLYAGRIAKVKGTDVLLEAIKILDAKLPDDVTFVFVGDHAQDNSSPFEQTVDRDSARLRDQGRIVFLGPKARSEMAGVFNAADIVVLPSRHEGTSLTALEAMSAQLPLIATAVGGTPQLIEHGHNGILIPPEEAHRLADEIQQLLESPKRGKDIGRVARSTILEKWTWTQVAHRIADVYAQVLALKSDH
jgi:glycosyltransferase involved in cell wall biosynthesis